MKDAQILRMAARYVRNNWAEARRLDPITGGMCAMGAINMAMHGDVYSRNKNENSCRAVRLVASLVPQAETPSRSIEKFNDGWKRTKDEVADKLEQAARLDEYLEVMREFKGWPMHKQLKATSQSEAEQLFLLACRETAGQPLELEPVE